MKHCWPAAHCQLHCCLDDWSIEGLRAFVIPPPCSDSPSPSLLSLFLPLCSPALVSFRFESIRRPRAADKRRRAAEAYISMLENVQNNVQEPPRSLLLSPAARILLSAPRVPLRADKRRPLSRRLSYSSRPIPVDSFQFRIYRDLGPPPASRNHASIVASSPDSPEGPCTNEDRTGERESVPRSFGVRPLFSFAPPISLSFCFFLSPSIICITSNLET